MKFIAGLLLAISSIFLISLNSNAQEKSIVIHDNQYDCYNSMEYTLTDSTIYIDNYDEEGDMHDSDYVPEKYLDIKLSKTQKQTLEDFMEKFPLNSLKTGYLSGAKKGCDSLRQIYIEINWNGKKKSIQIEDCYQKDIGMLLDTLNLLIPKNIPGDKWYNLATIKFDYTPDEFKCQK